MNLLKVLATVSGMTFISRVLGFLRDAIIARIFGAGLMTDAFFVAFRLPNLLRRLFAEGAFSQAFVPILAEYKNRRGSEDTKILVDHVSGVLALSLFVVSALGILAAPAIIYVTAPGFSASPDKYGLAVQMLRITFPYILFISLTAFAGGILNTYSRFSVPAFTPVLLNLSFIGFALWGAPYFDPPVLALAWAVFVGGILQLAFQVPFLARLKLLPRFRPRFSDPGVRRVLRQMGPAVFGVSIGQVSLVINTIFASFLVTGSVSWLYYADRLMEFPTGMLGVALGTILLPSLSKHHATSSTEAYSKLLDWGLRITLMLAVPAAVALGILAVPLVTTLFQYGAFSALDTLATRNAVIAYSVGLVGLILVKVLAPGFYARQDIRTPVRIAIVTLITTQVMNAILIWPLRHAGLALATSLGACLNAGLLFRLLRQRGIYQPQRGWGAFGLKLGLAVLLMAAAIWIASGTTAQWLAASASHRVTWLTAVVALGAAVYFVTLWAVGFRLRDFSQRAAE
ncbi:MAG TPA: murein biosynthesis integral membrane protein MurJ [Burkholderiales bacterium]|nr:murein biosynthesis integral membrane protein MurJ [Burkholderiales bacterium]